MELHGFLYASLGRHSQRRIEMVLHEAKSSREHSLVLGDRCVFKIIQRRLRRPLQKDVIIRV